MLQKVASGESSLCIMPANNIFPKTIDEWHSAYAIFSSVYIKTFQNESGKLLKYGELIRQIAHEGGDFNSYDVSFRKLKQTLPLSWDHFHCELYMKAFKGTTAGFIPNQNAHGGGEIPKHVSRPGVTVSDIRRDRISATQPNATNVCAVVSRLRSLLGRDEFLHPLEVRKFTYANIGHILRSNRSHKCNHTYEVQPGWLMLK